MIPYGLRAPAEILDEPSQLKFPQALVLKLRVLVPAFFLPTAVLGIALTVLNSATLTWQPSAPPKNWKALVNHEERFHIVGVWAAVMAFAFFLTAVVLKLAAH